MSSNLKQGKICFPVAIHPRSPSERKVIEKSVPVPDPKLEAILEDPPTNVNDLSHLCNKTAPLTADQKYKICCKVWRPDAKFVFPESILYGKEKKFSFFWLQDYKWLQYSTVLNGAFCLPCMLFGHQIGVNPCKVVKLVGSPFKDCSCAVTRFNMHSKSSTHQTALLTMQTFLHVKENKMLSVDRIHTKVLNDKIFKNRLKLIPIIKAVLPCARRNIPLCGHRDDSKHYEALDSGNFQALLNVRVDSGDESLKEHFSTAPNNATYRSKTTQNEIVSCYADIVNNK